MVGTTHGGLAYLGINQENAPQTSSQASVSNGGSAFAEVPSSQPPLVSTLI